MDKKIVFDPKLGLTPDQFTQAWNNDPAYANQGTAQVESIGTAKSMDLASTGLVIISGIAINLLSSLTYDLIKQMLAQRQSQQSFTIQVTEQPDGTKIILITAEKT